MSDMKYAGIVGGLGLESTVDDLQMFIKKYQESLGKIVELPELFINSINMYNVFQFISNDDLDGLVNYLVGAVEKLQLIGADFAVISANTPHIVFDQVRGKS